MTKKNVSIENARILFRNFSGAPGKFNNAGNRNFCVILDNSRLVDELIAEGWPIKYLRPREDGDVPTPYMSVKVSFGYQPPKIVLISSSGQTVLDEETISILDWAEIACVDLTIRPYNWEVNGNSGVKGYLKTMYVTLVEDEIEAKYRAFEDSAKESFIREEGMV